MHKRVIAVSAVNWPLFTVQNSPESDTIVNYRQFAVQNSPDLSDIWTCE